jgi:hypothetical protein
MGSTASRSSKKKSGQRRVAEYLSTVVGPGNVFHWLDVKHAFPHDGQIDRRGRELREHGWIITTYREDRRLAADEVRLDKIGRMP